MEHNELDEMRKQMALLNQKLDKEEIVSDEAISEVTRKNMDKVQRYAFVTSILIPIFFPLILNDMIVADNKIISMVIWIIWATSCLVSNALVFKGIRDFKKRNNTIAEAIKTIKKTKKINKIGGIINFICFYSYMLLWVMQFIVAIARNIGDRSFVATKIFGLVFFVIIVASMILTVSYVSKELGENINPENVLSQVLEELQEPNITETDGNETAADAETRK